MKKTIITLIAAFLFSTLAIAQYRPYDKTGINEFEKPKTDPVKFNKVKLDLGGSFTQSFQTLSHSNTASANITGTPPADVNKLAAIVPGFNTANANLYFDVLLGEGISLNMALYLSARHHNETWVKGGYIQFDKLPFIKSTFLDNIMKYTTLKIGHMEVNYGDAHFRRSDNGNSIYNPFVENYIMDGFATEIGGEVDFQYKGFIGVLGMSNGEIKGDIAKGTAVAGATNGKHHPAFIGKIGYDKQFNDKFRLRVSGSGYYTAGSLSNTLYGGDRSGSHYFGVMDNALTTSTAFSGRFNPGFSDKVGSLMGNLFLKYGGLEWFTTLETSKGRNRTEQAERTANQFATDLVFRFGKTENFWLGARYNTVSSTINTAAVTLDRLAFSGGWFVTKNIMAKLEYVNQNYNGFLSSDIRNGGKFNGLVFEAVVGF